MAYNNSKYSGVLEVAYCGYDAGVAKAKIVGGAIYKKDAGAATYTDPDTTMLNHVNVGDCIADSPGLKLEAKLTETGSGTQLYAGKVETFEVKVIDMTKFDALETIMKADGKIDIFIKTMGETFWINAILNSGVVVSKNYGMKVGERNYFTLKAQGYSI